MPYKIFPVKDGFEVWKVDAMGKKLDKPLSENPLTHEQAEAQQRVLYAAEDDTKETDTKMMPYEYVGPGPISFAELEAQESAYEVSEMADHFPRMVSRIMGRSDITDKNEAVRQLAVEFVGIVNDKLPQEQPKEVAKEEAKITKEDHYKAVEADDTVAQDEDFQGGCPHCEFGEAELMKGLEKCPYCYGGLIQFSGETLRDAIVNHNSMDIEEEQRNLGGPNE